MAEGRGRSKKLSKATYAAIKMGAAAPWEYWRVTMCERFGWTLEYWDDLDTADVHQIIAVWDGMAKAEDTRKGKHG